MSADKDLQIDEYLAKLYVGMACKIAVGSIWVEKIHSVPETAKVIRIHQSFGAEPTIVYETDAVNAISKMTATDFLHYFEQEAEFYKKQFTKELSKFLKGKA